MGCGSSSVRPSAIENDDSDSDEDSIDLEVKAKTKEFFDSVQSFRCCFTWNT